MVTLLRAMMPQKSRTTLGLRAPSGVGITTVQPLATADSAPKIEPPTWNCGSGLSSTEPGAKSNSSALLQAASASAPWVWRASLGRPVVPPVWNSAARVSRVRYLGATSLSGCLSIAASKSMTPGILPWPPTRKTLSPGIAARISSTLGQMSANSDGSAAISAFDPASFMMPAISEALRK